MKLTIIMKSQRKVKKKNSITNRFEYPKSTVQVHCNSTSDSWIKKYSKILKILARVVHLFGRQILAL